VALSSSQRAARYRRRHPQKWAETARRYSQRTGSEPGDFGGHKRGRKSWDAEEDRLVLEHAVPDRQLAEEIDRTVRAIAMRRSRLRREPQS
jgi:hypothetical protein